MIESTIQFDQNVLGQLSFESLLNRYATAGADSFWIWAGSGLSARAGLPTWPRLLRILGDESVRKANSFVGQDQIILMNKITIAGKAESPWRKVKLYREILGETTFRQIIRAALKSDLNGDIPSIYGDLWKLKIGGMLTTNLDRFAAASANNSKVVETSGRQIGDFIHLMKSDKKLCVNLHGDVDNSSEWVLDEDELSAILNSKAYQNFISSIMSSKTLLLIGITADDISVGGFFENLVKNNSYTGPHYWLTDRTDLTTDQWAERNGIQIIRYDSGIDRNHNAIDLIVSKLINVMPSQEEPLIEFPKTILQSELIPLTANDTDRREILRHQINKKFLSEIEKYLNNDEIERFMNGFRKEHFEEIYDCGMINTSLLPGYKFFSYILKRKIGEGAFGDVYEATDGSRRLAIKVLKADSRDNPEKLLCFRRGVQAHEILSKHRIDGMVEQYAAFTFPPTIIMEYIDGLTLEEFINKHSLNRKLSFSDRIRICLQLCEIVKSAHHLPSRVLHRDIRPANIMFKDYKGSDPQLKLVVLDFDLSWHRDAAGASLMTKGDSYYGYIAPELIIDDENATRRSTLVDSFGLGMTFYFVFSGLHPTPNAHRIANWIDRCHEALGPYRAGWKSAPARIARLIHQCTMQNQSIRPDSEYIYNELENLLSLCEENSTDIAEYWAEEIASLAFGPKRYVWDEDLSRATIVSASGLTTELTANETKKSIDVKIVWAPQGYEDTKNIAKFLESKFNQIKEKLLSAGYDTVNDGGGRKSKNLTCQILIERIPQNIQKLITCHQFINFLNFY